MNDAHVHDLYWNAAASRYELEENGKLAYADVRRQDGSLVIPYVHADPALRGKGTAGRLMEALVATARAEGLSLVPICGYAASWLARHPS